MRIEIRNESMRYIGMSRASMKEVVLKRLAIGQQYRLKSVNCTTKDYPVSVMCRLSDLRTNVAVFIHKNGTTESFTYPELWIQMMEGSFV